MEKILPRWDALRQTKGTREIWLNGLPPSVRGRVWCKVVSNPLGITNDLYEACIQLSAERRSTFSELSPDSNACSPKSCVGKSMSRETSPSIESGIYNSDESTDGADQVIDRSLKVLDLDLSRTYPTLGFFQNHSSPYRAYLRNILDAFVAFRPRIGYVQGMSFLAANLLLCMDELDAFVAFVHLIHRPCHYSLFTLDESEFMVYFHLHDRLVELYMPRVYHHLFQLKVEPFIYLYDWLLTMYSRTLPMDARMFVWDLFFLDGEITLFRTALAILRLFEDYLLQSDFDKIATLLTQPLSEDLTPDILVSFEIFTHKYYSMGSARNWHVYTLQMSGIKLVNMNKEEFRRVETQVRAKLTRQMNSPSPVPNWMDKFTKKLVSGGYHRIGTLNEFSKDLGCASPVDEENKNTPIFQFEEVNRTSRSAKSVPKEKRISWEVHDRKLSVSMDRTVVRKAQTALGIFAAARESTEDWNEAFTSDYHKEKIAKISSDNSLVV
ncbi:hypothetical protein Ciccas_004211 [Cichlidogyrus casuarinus]|uniref:Rab-GAP TBC domain-containing protein n=1 Tax=Cichlidogyrus casuarinus TaxID=1844966 RepID=A0ABD2QC47_9PLAT